MRVLHTSDWHLGRTFLGASMHEHQAAFLDWLVTLVDEQDVEAVLIAGDVYDRSVPPPASVELLNEALFKLSTHCPVVLTSGNHDSPTRLNFGGAFFERGGVHLRCVIADIDRPVRLTGRDGVQLEIFGLPYLEPDHHRTALGADRSHAAVLQAAMDRVRAARQPQCRSIVMAHAFITGGHGSDSERDVRVGGIGDAPASVFAGVDYVALGHLHGAQQIPTEGSIVRYSGSPLAFSFSEEEHTKSVTVLDIPADGEIGVVEFPTPVARSITTVRDSLERLLTDPRYEDHVSDWIRAILTDPRRIPDAMAKIRSRFPFALQLDYEQTERDASRTLVDVTKIPPLEVASRFVADVTTTPPTDAERKLLTSAIERVRIQGAPE